MAITVEELKQKAINLGQTGLNMAQTGVDKGIQLASVAKLKALNVKEEANLRAAYAELGRLYFADHGTEPDDNDRRHCRFRRDGDLQGKPGQDR